MVNVLQHLKGKTKLKFYQDNNRFYDDMNYIISVVYSGFTTNSHSLA